MKLFQVCSVVLLGKKLLGRVVSNRTSPYILYGDIAFIIITRREGHPGVKANLKAVQGDLFMLEKYLFFVSKSPLLIDLNDIYQVVFSRVGAGTSGAAGRTFDLKVITKSGPEHTFTSINKSEHEVTEAYLRDKRVKVKNEMVPDADLLLAAVDDDDDDDMASISSEDDSRDKSRQKRTSNGENDDESEEDGMWLKCSE